MPGFLMGAVAEMTEEFFGVLRRDVLISASQKI